MQVQRTDPRSLRLLWGGGIEAAVTDLEEDHGDLRGTVSVSVNGSKPARTVARVRLWLGSAQQQKALAEELARRCRELTPQEWRELVHQVCLAAAESWTAISPIRPAELPAGNGHLWLLEPYLLAEGISLLYGDGGSGKSLAAAWIALRIATERPVLYLDWEAGPGAFQNRIRALARGMGRDVPGQLLYAEMRASLRQAGREAARIAAAEGCAAVIIDTAGPAGGADPESASTALAFHEISRSFPCPTLALHHIPKNAKDPSKPFGSVYYHNLARLAWHLVPLGGGRASLHCRKFSWGPLLAPRRLTFGFEGDAITVREERT
jgi:hypothetical protein